jgi:hypothetical protein
MESSSKAHRSPGTATGTAILMDWGTSAGSDYGTGHRIGPNVTIIGYKGGIAAVDPHAELVTDSVIHGAFVYCEAQANSIGIADVYDGSAVSDTEIEGCTYGVKLASSTGQGTTLVANRYEANTTADLYVGAAVYNVTALGNHHANGSGGNVFASNVAQRNNYVIDGTLGYAVQAQPIVNAAARSSQTAEPVTKWYNYAESSNPLFTAQLFGTSGGTNPFGESVTTREMDLACGDVVCKTGTTATRNWLWYINNTLEGTLSVSGLNLVQQMTAAGYTCNGSTSCGAQALTAGSATVSVRSGCRAICTDTTANASVKCSVSSTTLTITGTGTDTINWFCF